MFFFLAKTFEKLKKQYGPKVSDIELAEHIHICMVMDDGSIHVIYIASLKVTSTWIREIKQVRTFYVLYFLSSTVYNVKVNQRLCVVSIWINMHRYDDLFENNDVIQKAFLYQLHYRFTLSCLMCLHVFCGFSSVNSTNPGWKSV